MSVNTALAIQANTNAAVAQHEAGEAKAIACLSVEKSFNPATATVVQKQQYADCVDHLYPQSDPGTILFLQILVLTAVVGCVVGAASQLPRKWNGKRYWAGHNFMDVAFGAFAGMIGAPVFAATISGFFYAVRWALTVQPT